jgi:gliding motility-associated-like protein
MKKNITYISLLLSLIVLNNKLKAQCALLFIKAPDTICIGSPQLVLQTSKMKGSNVKYIWRLPKGDSIVTTDTILKIDNPVPSLHAGNYFVSAKTDSCRSSAVGPFNVVLLGAPTAADTVKKIQLCGINETKLSSKFKTSSTISGKWTATEGVQIVNDTTENTEFKNIHIGENLLIWAVSTKHCRSFFRDSFKVTLQAIPRMNPQNFTLDVRNASVTIPLGTISGSNINSVEDLEIIIYKPPKQGTIPPPEGKRIKYERKVGYQGPDNFSLIVCNKRCPSLCSVPTNFQINVFYDEQYPNVTVPKVLSTQQMDTQDFVIENVASYPNNELQILDRWGTVLEKRENYPRDGLWNGVHKGKQLPSGAYYFMFQAKSDKDIKFKPLTGIFFIID